jgi:hypothetical protein
MKTAQNNTMKIPPEQQAVTVTTKLVSETEMKTLLCIVDDKGGVGKSADAAHIRDTLMELGYRVRIADADSLNRTLSQLIPDVDSKGQPVVTRLDGDKSTEMINYILDTATSEEDVTIIDMPGGSSKILNKAKISLDAFKQAGIRVVIVIAITEEMDAVLGSRAWLKSYGNRVEYLVIANEKQCADGEPFNPAKIPGLQPIINATGGRLAVIPKFSETLMDIYKDCKSSPKGYQPGGWAAKKLGLHIYYSGLWQTHFQDALISIAPHAEYLTGKPIPKPPVTDVISEADQSMNDLCLELDAFAP